MVVKLFSISYNLPLLHRFRFSGDAAFELLFSFIDISGSCTLCEGQSDVWIYLEMLRPEGSALDVFTNQVEFWWRLSW